MCLWLSNGQMVKKEPKTGYIVMILKLKLKGLETLSWQTRLIIQVCKAFIASYERSISINNRHDCFRQVSTVSICDQS